MTEAFVAYIHGRNLIQLCCLIHRDEEVKLRTWFPSYTVDEFDDNPTELDQPLTLEGCMLISLSSCDLVHTKNLKNTRSRLCDRLGLIIPAMSTVLEA